MNNLLLMQVATSGLWGTAVASSSSYLVMVMRLSRTPG